MRVHFPLVGALMLFKCCQAMNMNPEAENYIMCDGELVKVRYEGNPNIYVHMVLDSTGQPVDEDCNPITPSRTSISTSEADETLERQRIASMPARVNGQGNLRRLSGPTVIKNLVLLIKFSDHNINKLKTKSQYETLFNSNTKTNLNPTGSIKQYYLDQSFGKISVESVVTDWITVSFTEAEAAGGCSALCISPAKLRNAIVEALNTADSLITSDFDTDGDDWIDMITVIHSGFSAEASDGKDENDTPQSGRIWSHKWVLPSTWTSSSGIKVWRYSVNPGNFGIEYSDGISRIGVIVHEIGHFFGLPDLYDTDYSSSGISIYGVMANSWGVNNDQLYPGSLSPWCKHELGWITPISIPTGQVVLEPGNDQDDNKIYMMTRNYPSNERIYIENRKSHEWDDLLDGGILIFHVDVNKMGNDNEYKPGQDPTKHYLVRVIQARNPFKLESAPFHNNYDQNGWWNSGQTLSDFSGTNTLLPYYELNRGTNCRSTGNTFSNFGRVGTTDNYKLDYSTDIRRDCDSPPDPEASPTKSPVTGPTRSPVVAPTRSPSPEPEEPEGIPNLNFRGQWINNRRKVRFRWNKSPIKTKKVRLLRNGKIIRRTNDDGLFVLSVRPKPGGKIPFQMCENKAVPRCSEIIYM